MTHFHRKYLIEKTLKVARLTRLIAKVIDLIVVFSLGMVNYPLGIFAGILYLSIADSLGLGQSFGKKFMGFRVKSLIDGAPCSLKQSVVRNFPLTLPMVFFFLPVWGWILGGILIILLFGFELYLLYSLDSGHRLGDVMADTSVMANDDHYMGLKNQKADWFKNANIQQ